MADHVINQVEQIAPLLARFERLDEFYKGVLDMYVSSTICTLATGLDLAEQMQAKTRAPKRQTPAPTHLRVVASRKEAHRG